MKKHNTYKSIKIYGLFMLLLGTLSCNDDLELLPEDSISDVSFWKNANDFELAANNFYFSLKTYSNEPDANSDIVTSCETYNTVSDGSYIPSEQSSVWNNTYNEIRGVNNLISKAQEYEGEVSEIQQYVGEAKFFRAYLYFRLLKNFGGVPLILKPLDIDSEELFAKRADRKEVVAQLLEDLQEAINMLPSAANLADEEEGRISSEAAESFMARVALFEGTWQKFRNNGSDAAEYLKIAADAANNVINSGAYGIFDQLGDDSYRYLFLIDNNAVAKSNPLNLNKSDINEFIITRKYSFEFGITNGHSHGVTQENAPTKKMADFYLCSDGLPIDKSPLFQGRSTFTSEFENRDNRMRNSLAIPGIRYYSYGALGRDFDNSENPGEGTGIHKANFGENTCTGYTLIKFTTEKKDISLGQEETDYPVLRYSEVLLIFAEAKYELNGSITDEELNRSINLLRNRAKLPSLTNAFVESNALDMREEIRRERTVELFMEGFRLEDLKRWKTAETELPKSLRGILYDNTAYADDPDYDKLERFDENGFYVWQFSANRRFEEKHYLFPLPTQQVELMGIEQNPGW
ncbi:RagB/SusD family nutrient uptake outer membrane protein [Zobellia alginiliquefaciens]|uniref:RagB/SusD family nutrient uptake outer membrane protein n=1 Tax=Zobellia alginiliquefaciens TaxID=3032586 RepID=UPI0023E43D7F|nr:RagB/SusD family nutrient uptake outer membrane protein [Zobellia alginiliquefaciens]